MAQYRVAIIGTGRPRREEGATGFGMSHYHAAGYRASGECDLVALADISRANAAVFRDEHGTADTRLYEDYRQMLAEAKPDVVSVCTWPALHGEMVMAAAEAGVQAIHCEKPMAPTWGEARRMRDACARHGTQLTFNHQRRFEAQYRTARRLIHDGAVGRVLQMQMACSNLYDWVTHWFDMLFFYNGETPAEWVLAQIDSRTDNTAFGVPLEDRGISLVGFQNDVRGLLITGDQTRAGAAEGRAGGPGNPLGTAQRIIGTQGMLEVGMGGGRLRLLGGAATGFQDVPPDPAPTDTGGAIGAGIADLLRCLVTGEEPELSVNKAIRTTELIFASYESSRRRARVDLPLQIEDSPFLAMLQRGEVGPPRV